MAYKFLDVIQDIKADLRYAADKAKEEKQRIDTRQAEINEELDALEPRLLRAKLLESIPDLICAHCFINENVKLPLRPLEGDRYIDRFRCAKCETEYELHVN